MIAHVRVQPRPCGEYYYKRGYIENSAGSTPPVRGICELRGYKRYVRRFNPARAGNIFFAMRRLDLRQVQPRPCGEYLQGEASSMVEKGSTPPVRGISGLVNYVIDCHRFNPARAGNIHVAYQLYKCIQVQPRPCGEYINSGMIKCYHLGSTPPVRGIYRNNG